MGLHCGKVAAMIDTDDEQSSQVIWLYADEPLDTLIGAILSVCILGAGAFRYGVRRLPA